MKESELADTAGEVECGVRSKENRPGNDHRKLRRRPIGGSKLFDVRDSELTNGMVGPEPDDPRTGLKMLHLSEAHSGDLLDRLINLKLADNSLRASVASLQVSAPGKAVQLSHMGYPDTDSIRLLAAAFARGAKGQFDIFATEIRFTKPPVKNLARPRGQIEFDLG